MDQCITSVLSNKLCKSSLLDGLKQGCDRGEQEGGWLTWASVQTSSAGLSERQPTLRGPCRQLLKAMGMSSARGRFASSCMTLPVLQTMQWLQGPQHAAVSHMPGQANTVFLSVTVCHHVTVLVGVMPSVALWG